KHGIHHDYVGHAVMIDVGSHSVSRFGRTELNVHEVKFTGLAGRGERQKHGESQSSDNTLGAVAIHGAISLGGMKRRTFGIGTKRDSKRRTHYIPVAALDQDAEICKVG